MLKFLRKYDKWILAIGGSLLMVAFLLPQALQQVGQQGAGRVVATYAGGEITAQDRFDANPRLNFLRNTAPRVLAQLGVDDVDHWILLVEEARRAGFVGGPQAGREYFNNLARLEGIDSEEAFPLLLAASGVSENVALDAYAKLSAVDRMRLVHLQSQRLSTPEVKRQFFADTPTVGLHAALIPAESLLESITKFPAPNELQAFFDEHKDQPRGSGKLDFGYRVEDAVKFEWIDLAPNIFQQAVVLDPVEVNARWRRARSIYEGEFSDERPRVEEDMRREAVSRLISDAQTVVRATLSRAERDGTSVDLQQLAEAIRRAAAERGTNLPDIPFDQRDDSWKTRTTILATPRVRNARLQSDGRTSFADLALNVRELNPDDPHGAAVGDIVGPFRSNSGSLIYARVTDARPAGAPESLDAVREQVVEDYRLQQAWEQLRQRAARYPDQIAVRGISTVVADAGGDMIPALRATPVSLARPQAGSINNTLYSRLNKPAFAEDVSQAALNFEPIGDLRDLPADERVVVTELPDEAALALAEIIAHDPVTTAAYLLAMRDSISALEFERLAVISTGGPYSFERMKERLGYENLNAREDEEALIAELEAEGS